MFKSYEEQREERRRIEADVHYEIWRSGGNPDIVNLDRIDDGIYEGKSAEEIARTELRVQRQAREARREREQQEQEEIDSQENQ